MTMPSEGLHPVGEPSPSRVLVVDDDDDWRGLLVRFLTGAGYDVTDVASGQACLDFVQSSHPDLILLDVEMPGMSGLEVCRRIKEDPATAHLFVVFLSAARTSSDDQSFGLELGADGYIGRPIAQRELVARVHAMLRIQKAEAAQARLLEELKQSFAEIRTLRGLIPICASCKKIRNDQGLWDSIEVYLSRHTDAQLSHGICPACSARLYPGL